MKTNVKQKSPPIFTHEGAVAAHINPYQQLRRSVLACLLFETEFYEDGQEIAKRIIDTAALCTPEQVAALAVAARRTFGLRHAPLLLLLDLIKRGGKLAGDTIANTVKRADDLTELVALYWKFNPGKPLTKQMKIGLGRSLLRFDAYGLAKYNRDGAVKLRDILFLTHAKPEGEAQEVLFKQLAENALPIPDTWETELSAGKDKRETFTRLLNEGKLGYLALLRNLRNMTEAGVDTGLIKAAILARKGADLVFPFRYTAAARIVPQLERELDQALIASVKGNTFSGKTIVLVDVSGSMDAQLSGKSDLKRQDAAATLASVIDGDVRVAVFDTGVIEVPHRLGMAGVDAILKRHGGGTDIDQAVRWANRQPHDRLIVITDEQSATRVSAPVAKHAYMINVASNRNGVGYNNGWRHLDGFSEAVLRYINAIESEA